MDKSEDRPFKGIFQDPETGKDRVKQLTEQLVTEQNLKPLYDFLSSHRDFSSLEIQFSQLSENFVNTLENLVDDLEDCKSLIQISATPPAILKQELNSLKSHVENIERILESSPIISMMIDSILSEGIFDKSTNFYLLQSAEVRKLLNSSTKPYSTVQTLKDVCSKMKIESDRISQMMPTKESASSMIWATRIKYFPDINKKRLLKYAYDTKNRLLFITAFHLEILAKKLGIETDNGTATFISIACQILSNDLEAHFSNLGTLNNISSNTIIELFRSEAWNFRKFDGTVNYLGKDYLSKAIENKNKT
ncbi:MAG: hypothetical protein WC635_05465 [Bacteriovorax sp.]|jgi:hypothetical protein